jgi:hypothetical protein
MATVYEINQVEQQISVINDSIATYQNVLNDPTRSAISKQVAQTNLDRYTAKLATAQAQLQKLQAQGEPARDAPADQANPTQPVVKPAPEVKPETQQPTTDPAISDAEQTRQANATKPLAEPAQVTVTASPNTPGVQINSQQDVGKLDPTAIAPDPNANSPSYFDGSTVAEPTSTTPYSAQLDSFPTPIVEQKTLSPAEDAAAAKALEAQSPTVEESSPNEQTVINASQDAQLSAEQKTALEKKQADNRAVLAKQTAGQTEPNIASSVDRTRAGGIAQFQRNIVQQDDWRLRLSLAKTADYLYRAATVNDILYPLQSTDGVVFPYTPQIQMGYRASYEPTDLTHSNYKIFYYKNSSVDDVTITADFTAQDTAEATYLLAVMHFFKSVTKMFYGQDKNPVAGTPPPLCYLNGLGQYQFNEHPVLVGSFSYTLPNDVDYIRAGRTTQVAGQSYSAYVPPAKPQGANIMSILRASSNRLTKGGISAGPVFQNLSNKEVTYVPTKIQFQITLHPVVTRDSISKSFSLKDYATGKLTTGNKRSGGGIW